MSIKQDMRKGLHSACRWLNQAEESFDKDRDIRGELDLMLAQAELQHVREVSRSQQWRYKYPLLRHALSISMAVMIAGVGLAGVYWYSEKPGHALSASPIIQSEPKSEPRNVPNTIIPSTPAVAELSRIESAKQFVSTELRAEKPEISLSTPDDKTDHQADKTVMLTPDEMQKLVRAAGKSLRGQ